MAGSVRRGGVMTRSVIRPGPSFSNLNLPNHVIEELKSHCRVCEKAGLRDAGRTASVMRQ